MLFCCCCCYLVYLLSFIQKILLIAKLLHHAFSSSCVCPIFQHTISASFISIEVSVFLYISVTFWFHFHFMSQRKCIMQSVLLFTYICKCNVIVKWSTDSLLSYLKKKNNEKIKLK